MTLTGSSRLLHHPIVIPLGEPLLEIAGSLQSSAVDGPGNRYVIFLQGCNFDCVACHNPTTIGRCDACGACVDGPGNRYVIFLQGCNFDCVACHNPTTIGRCDACGACVDACPHGALSFPEVGVVAYEEAACDHCRACVAPCPIDSDPAIRVVSAETVVDEIRGVAGFLSGITVTGGEPTMQLDALVALFTAVKADPDLSRLTTLVDSNGTLDPPGWERLLPVTDGAMIDLKAASLDLHERMTGHGNEPVKRSIELLAPTGKLAEVRLLVIEGVTDTDDELEAWAGFVAGVDPQIPVRVMTFRHQGTRPQAQEWPETSPEAAQRVRDRLTELGLGTVLPT